MFIHRKSFGGEWKIVALSAEDVAKAERMTVGYGFKVLKMIRAFATEKNIVMAPGDLEIMAGMFPANFQGFSSDLIEANYLQSKEKQEPVSPT
jgi:hypothetical protein